jgi:hypothetical protein
MQHVVCVCVKRISCVKQEDAARRVELRSFSASTIIYNKYSTLLSAVTYRTYNNDSYSMFLG